MKVWYMSTLSRGLAACRRATSPCVSSSSTITLSRRASWATEKPDVTWKASLLNAGIRASALPSRRLQALHAGQHVGAHVALHHAQSGLGQLLVDVGHAVAAHRDLEPAHVGVEGRVENALLGDLPGQDHPADLLLA